MIAILILLTTLIFILVWIKSLNDLPTQNDKKLKENKYPIRLIIVISIVILAIFSFCLYQNDCRKILEKQQNEYCNELMRQQRELLRQEAKKKEEELQKTLSNNNYWNKGYEEVEAEREQRELENRKMIEDYKAEQSKIDEGAVPAPFSLETNRKSIYEEIDTVCHIPYSNTEVFKYSIKRLSGAK